METSEGSTLQTTYEYDAVGNRIKMDQSGIITEYTYNPLNQLLTSKATDLTGKVASNVTYDYDVKGNQREKVDSVTKEKVSYTYDVQNQLTYVAGRNADGSGHTQTNAYNGNGQRISKIDTSTQVESTDSTTTVTNYYYQNGTVLYTTNGSGTMTTFNLLGQSGNVMGTIRYNGKNEYYVYNKDTQGSTSTIVNASSEVCAAYYYDDFGTATELLGDKVGNEITYTGAVQDTSTGLYYMNARYYDSETGRFISKDTYRGGQKDAGTWHLYAYCANNPINYVDPSGHWRINISRTVGGFICSTFLITVIFIRTAFNAARLARWAKKYRGFRNIFDKAINKLAKSIYSIMNSILYEIAGRQANVVTRSFTVARIKGILDAVLTFSPGYAIAYIVDCFDGDGKSGYIRW